MPSAAAEYEKISVKIYPFSKLSCYSLSNGLQLTEEIWRIPLSKNGYTVYSSNRIQVK